MTEEWSEVSEPPAKKGGLPKWFWWTCGIGCLLAVLVAAAVGIGGFFVVQRAMDPEFVHPKLMQYLPCDQWPEGYHGSGMEVMGMGTYSISWPGGGVMLQPMPGRAEMAELMDPDSSANWTNSDAVVGEMEVQGRTVPTLTFDQIGGITTLRADLSGDVGPFFAISIMDEDEPDPAQLEEFLEPFDVWRGED